MEKGGRSIGDERGKGGWGGGQMLLTLCTLTWVSIFSILYLYTFLFCADKENLFTYQVQCTLLIGNYILCLY